MFTDDELREIATCMEAGRYGDEHVSKATVAKIYGLLVERELTVRVSHSENIEMTPEDGLSSMEPYQGWPA